MERESEREQPQRYKMYPSLNPHTTAGSDSIRNPSNFNMDNIHSNAYPGVSSDRATESYISQPLWQPPCNAFRGDLFYLNNAPQGSSSQHLPSIDVPFSSTSNISLQDINNANRDFANDYASRCAYTCGIMPHSSREGYTTALHAYSGNPISQSIHRMSTSGTPAMVEYSHDHVALARHSSASSLSTRASGPGENGTRPITFPGAALPYYRPTNEYYFHQPSSRNSRMEDGAGVAPDNVMIPPPCLQNSTYHDHQIVGTRVGTSAHLTTSSTSTQAPPLAILPNNPFIYRSLPPDLTSPSITGLYTHGINPIASTDIGAAALPQSSSILTQSLRLASTNEHKMAQNNQDNDGFNNLRHMNLRFNEGRCCEPQAMLANAKQYRESYITQEKELVEDESVFARISVIERTLMELLSWCRTALSSFCLSLPSLSGYSGDTNADTDRDVGVIIQTQAGQVEMDLQVSSYLLECLECVEKQLLPLEDMLHKFFHKYIIADGNLVLANNTIPISSTLEPSKAASPQPVISGRQEEDDVFTSSRDTGCLTINPSDPTITFASTKETHLTEATCLKSAHCMSKELSSRYEHIRQLLLDDILLGQPITFSSYGDLNLSNDVGRLSHNSCMSSGGAGLTTIDSSHACHGGNGDQLPHEFLPLRLIMIPADGNDNGRHSTVAKTTNRVTALGPVEWETRPQESNLALSIAERHSSCSSGRNTASSTVTLLASSPWRGSEQLVAVVSTPVRYAQYQLFLTISTAVEHLNHALHLGQLRNQKELQKTCEGTQTSSTIAMINTVPNETLLSTRINLQKDAEVFRMWANRVEALQDRLQRIKRDIHAAVRGHASVRRQVLEILNQRLNNDECGRNGDDSSAQRCCDSGIPVGPHDVESELNSPGASTIAFCEASSLCQPDGTSFGNSNDINATTVAKVTRVSPEEEPLSHSIPSDEAFQFHDLPSASGAHQPVSDGISSERQPQQLRQCDNNLSHDLLLPLGDKKGQPTCNIYENDLEHCTNKFLHNKAPNVGSDWDDTKINTRNILETENLTSSGLHTESRSNTDPSYGPVDTEELYSPYDSGRKHGSWCDTTCRDEGVSPTHQTLVSLPHDTSNVAYRNSKELEALDGRGSPKSDEGCEHNKVLHQFHTCLDSHKSEGKRILSFKKSDDCKWRMRKTSRSTLPPAEPRARDSSVCSNDSSDDDDPIEYSLRNPNNLFRGFKAFLKAVVRRATSFDSDDSDSNENSRKRPRRG